MTWLKCFNRNRKRCFVTIVKSLIKTVRNILKFDIRHNHFDGAFRKKEHQKKIYSSERKTQDGGVTFIHCKLYVCFPCNWRQVIYFFLLTTNFFWNNIAIIRIMQALKRKLKRILIKYICISINNSIFVWMKYNYTRVEDYDFYLRILLGCKK